MIRGRPVLHPRIDDGSDERLYLTKIHTNDFVGVSLLHLMLDSDVKDNPTLVIQADSWATHLTFTKSLAVLWHPEKNLGDPVTWSLHLNGDIQRIAVITRRFRREMSVTDSQVEFSAHSR